MGIAKRISMWFENQIDEIANSPSLRFYGCFLSLNSLLAAHFWYSYNFGKIFSRDTTAICWPMFKECQKSRIFNELGMEFYFGLLAIMSLLTALFFLIHKIRVGYFLLILLELAKIYLISLDYQARLNQHYMSFFAFLIFVAVPHKKLFSKYILILFYFVAGLLKLKPEWYSGEAIYGKLFLIPDSLKSPAAIYVVILELFFVWGLLSKNRKIFLASLVQFYLFHLTSFTVVGPFYPLLMFNLLMIFPLTFFITEKEGFIAGRKAVGYALMGFIILLNIWPRIIPGDTSITGEGRLLSLHMFDSKVYCESTAQIRYKNQPPIIKDLRLPVFVRIRCDPVIFISQLRKLCRELKPNPEFLDIDWSLKSSRDILENKRVVVDLNNFCIKDPSYRIWGFNAWITKSYDSKSAER